MTTLNYDSSGFVLGINRMKDGIDNVHDDTQEIIAIFKSQNQISNTRMRELTRAVKFANYRSESQASASTSRARSSSLDRRPRISSSSSTDSINNRNSDRTSSRTTNRSTISRSSLNAADRALNNASRNGGVSDTSVNNDSSDQSSSTARRERDANGRFISESSSSGFRSSGSNVFGGVGSLGNTNIGGVDPLLDSLNEAKDLLSPLGRGIKLAGRGAKFSWSKIKAMKRREPLSNDETRHNNENEKLLDKIWKAIKKNGGGNGGGLGGGLLGFGGIGKKLKKGLKFLGNAKILGPLAALAGTAGLAMDWDTLDHKGKSEGVGRLAGAGGGAMAGAAAGAAVGSIVPIVGTAVGGLVGMAVGGWLGSEGGEALGAAASPYIDSWTTTLIAYNLPKKMGDTWDDGIKPFFTRLDDIAGKMSKWIEDNMTDIVDAANNFADDTVDFVTGGDNSIWTGETANLKGVSAKAVHTASQYKAGNIGGLDDAMTRRLVASTVQTESAGGNPSAVNSGGYLGRYQAGAAWLADAGMIRGGADAVKGAKKRDGYGGKSDWAWASSGGMTKFLKDSRNWTEGMSREKYLSSPDIQDKAFQKATSKSYDQLKRMGAITSSTSQAEVAGLLKAAHLGGAGNANKVAKGGVGATDANGTSTRKYYNDIVQNKDGLNAAIRDKTIVDNVKESLVVEPSKKKGDKITKTPSPKSGNGILGVSVNDINEAVAPKITKSSNGTPLKSNLGYESANSPASPILKISKTSANTPLSSSSGYAPANLPATPILKIPKMQAQQQRLDSGGNNPVIMQASNDTINQNVSDRGLAHAITGGIGQDRYWG